MNKLLIGITAAAIAVSPLLVSSPVAHADDWCDQQTGLMYLKCHAGLSDGTPCITSHFGPPDADGNGTVIYEPTGCNPKLH